MEAEVARINAAALMRAQGESRGSLADPEPVETLLASDAELIDAVAVPRDSRGNATEIRAWARAGLAALEGIDDALRRLRLSSCRPGS